MSSSSQPLASFDGEHTEWASQKPAPAGAGSHAQHGSTVHDALQPSPFALLPSSQSSPASTVELPQTCDGEQTCAHAGLPSAQRQISSRPLRCNVAGPVTPTMLLMKTAEVAGM